MAYKLPDIKDRLEPNDLYNEMTSEYDFMLDVLLGGDNFISQNYLVKHAFETNAAYKRRLQKVWYFDLPRKIVSSFVEPIFKEGVIRKNLDEVESFINDATGYGDCLDDVMCELGILSAYFGISYIFVDYAFSEVDDVEIDLGVDTVMPVVNVFSPVDLIAWEKRRRYGFMWATFKTKKIIDGQLQEVYISVDYEKIYEVDKDGNDITKPYEHGLGYTPVFEFKFPGSFRHVKRQGLGLNLAYIMKGMINCISVVEELGEKRAFHQLTLPDDGSIEEWQAKQSELRQMQYDEEYNLYLTPPEHDFIGEATDPTLKKLSNASVLTFPSNTGHPPNYISPPVSGIGDVWKVVRDSIFLAMYVTGIQRYDGSFDIEFVSSKCSKVAKTLSGLEKYILKTVFKYIGNEMPDDANVFYPDTFSLMSLQNWLETVMGIAGLSNTNVNIDYVNNLLREVTYLLPLPLSQVDKGNMAKSAFFEGKGSAESNVAQSKNK